MTRRLNGIGVVLALGLVVGGCAAGKAFRQGDAAMRAGDLDQAVAYYRKAVQASPDTAPYKIALQRAMQAASRTHIDKGREFEAQDQLEAALGEYRQATEYDPSNRQAAAKVTSIDRTIRDRVEAARPKPPIQQMRERAKAASAEPILNPASREPLNIRFNNASFRDILNFISNATGINVMYDREYSDRPTTVQLDGVTLEQALNQLLSTNQLSYKVLNERSMLVFPDTPPKHGQYDEQVVRTFYISHADATELSQVLSTTIRLPGMAIQPSIAANKTSNTITIRATSPVAAIIEKMIEQNDKPRAEVVVDVEILEVDRNRVKQYGLNLSEYALGGIFSPETTPGGGTTTGTTTGTTAAATTSRGTSPSSVSSPPAFNVNSISRGITTADFYMAIPTAVVKFLESDTQTKLVAKPQLRGAEGSKLTLNLGDEIPVISTSYTPIAGGGAAVNPLSSYQYKNVGINVDMTPRVTLEGDVMIDLTVESSSRGTDVNIAGQNIPSFGTRKVTTKLRLRDGESNLLAGLLREDDRKALSGFPGAIHVPILQQLFSNNDRQIQQTDIVMLLTPHVVRTHEITESDLRSIYIGSQGNMGLNGPPPLIATAAPEPAAAPVPAPAAAAPAAVAPAGQRPGVNPVAPGAPAPPVFPAPTQPGSGPQVVTMPPPGTSPVPGTVAVPQGPQAPTPPAVTVTMPNPASPDAAAAPQPSAPPVGQPPATPANPANTPATQPLPPVTPPPAEPLSTPGMGQAQVSVTPPGTPFRVGGGPYTVPVSVSNAARLSTITLTLTYDANLLRVRTVQEGSFMRQGGVNVAFAQQAGTGRVDVTLTRAADATGASGTGLLAAILFDAIAPGTTPISLSGTASGPGATVMGLQFQPVTVQVVR